MSTARIIAFPVERRHARQLVTMRELCEQFSFSERWFRYRLAEGMPAHRWGHRLRFDPVEVQAWLDGHPSEAGSRGRLLAAWDQADGLKPIVSGARREQAS